MLSVNHCWQIILVFSVTISATLFLERSTPMIVSTRVDWGSQLPPQPPQPHHQTDVSCKDHQTDIMAMEWGHKKVKDDKKYSTLILKMCNGSEHTVVLEHQMSILGPEALVEEYVDHKYQAQMDRKTMAQDDDDCMGDGQLESDPTSQVTLIGCPDDDDGQVLTIVSDKHTFKSSSYRFSGGHVEMANGLFHDTIVIRQDRPNVANGGEGWGTEGTARHHKEGQLDNSLRNQSTGRPDTDQGVIKEPHVGTGMIIDKTVLNYYKGKEDLDSNYPTLELKHMNNKLLDKLHKTTKEHWADQHKKNRDNLEKILKAPNDEILVHEHSVRRLPPGRAKRIYLDHTIELCVITDPYLFNWIQTNFGLASDEAVTQKIYRAIHRVLIEAQTFLRHSSISSHGGFKIKLNGIRVLKDWGSLFKMSKRQNLQDVLFDLGDYLQVVNHKWDGHNQSYDLVVLFTGKMGFEDGDGYAYIGGICQQDAPISIKMRFDKDKLNLNMGRLLAHEIGHALGANHDDDFPPCHGQDYLMNSIVSNSMNTWSKCSASDIDKIVTQRTEDSLCFHI